MRLAVAADQGFPGGIADNAIGGELVIPLEYLHRSQGLLAK
jgi:hypothetical protein